MQSNKATAILTLLAASLAAQAQTTHEDSIELRNTGFNLILGSRTIDLSKSHRQSPFDNAKSQYVQHGHFDEKTPRQVILFTDLCGKGHLFCKHGASFPALAESVLVAGAQQKSVKIEVFLERRSTFSWKAIDPTRAQVTIEAKEIPGIKCCAHTDEHTNYAWVITTDKLLNGTDPTRIKRPLADNASVSYTHPKINNRDVRIGRIKMTAGGVTHFDRAGLRGCTFLEVCSKEEGCDLVKHPPACGATAKDWAPANDGKALDDCRVEHKHDYADSDGVVRATTRSTAKP